jgi:hypothetical protein
VSLACQNANVTPGQTGAGTGGSGGTTTSGAGGIGLPGQAGARGGGQPGCDPDGLVCPDAALPPPPPESPPDAPVTPPPPPAPGCACAATEICISGQCKPRGALVDPGFAACTDPPCINVLNNCKVPLWTHAIGTVPIDDGFVRRLDPGQSFRYTAVPQHGGGRLYAYYKEPENKQDRQRLVSDFNQFVEMTVDRDNTGRWAQNYNISYVDYMSLPVLMKGAAPGCEATQCGFRYEDWVVKLKECPTDLRNQHGELATCTASYNYCITPDGAASYDTIKPYCHKMQAKHGFPGSAIYGGSFPQMPSENVAFWDGVAAWNRGTFAGDADDRNYYKTEPYNHYAGFIHDTLGCPRVYAFSTDDHQDKAGFVRCTADELTVIWCPNR